MRALGDESEASAKAERLATLNRVLGKHDVMAQLLAEEQRLMATSAMTPPGPGRDTRVSWAQWIAQRPAYLKS